jgi:hypothetical protein
MISGVICYLKGLLEKGLAIAIRKGSIDIFFLLMQKSDKGFPVGRYLVEASFPGICIGGEPFLYSISLPTVLARQK